MCFAICQHIMSSKLDPSVASSVCIGKTKMVDMEISLCTQTRTLRCAVEVAFLVVDFSPVCLIDPKGF